MINSEVQFGGWASLLASYIEDHKIKSKRSRILSLAAVNMFAVVVAAAAVAALIKGIFFRNNFPVTFIMHI